MTEALQRQLDALTERNEALQLENLRFRTSGPKLQAAVVRCSSSFSSMRGGVATSLKQFTLALGKDFGELLQAVTAVDIAARVDSRSQEAALERLQSSLQQSQSTVQTQEGRMQALAAQLEAHVFASYGRCAPRPVSPPRRQHRRAGPGSSRPPCP